MSAGTLLLSVGSGYGSWRRGVVSAITTYLLGTRVLCGIGVRAERSIEVRVRSVERVLGQVLRTLDDPVGGNQASRKAVLDGVHDVGRELRLDRLRGVRSAKPPVARSRAIEVVEKTALVDHE